MSLPLHLSTHAAQGISENQTVAQFEIDAAKNFVYLILDWKTRAAALIDPQKDLAPPIAALEKFSFSLTKILLTHTHWDHIAGVPELVKRFPDVAIFCHPQDLHRLDAKTRSQAKIHELRDEERINVGDLSVTAMHTPGHSAGECSYFLDGTPPYLFTGDTVFIRDCGRTDFSDGSNEQMFASLQRIKKLPPKTVILPGHHYKPECASTIEREMKESAPFRCKTVEELANLP